jgi:hypothetical protein
MACGTQLICGDCPEDTRRPQERDGSAALSVITVFV